MGKDNIAYIKHIRDALVAIENHIKGVSSEEFLRNRLIQSAVIREFEIIGEASKNLTPEYRKAHSEIPWKDITGMRDKLIHKYFGVDLEIVWRTAKEKIPSLKKQIFELLKS